MSSCFHTHWEVSQTIDSTLMSQQKHRGEAWSPHSLYPQHLWSALQSSVDSVPRGSWSFQTWFHHKPVFWIIEYLPTHLPLDDKFLKSGTYPKGNVSNVNSDKKKLDEGELSKSYSLLSHPRSQIALNIFAPKRRTAPRYFSSICLFTTAMKEYEMS